MATLGLLTFVTRTVSLPETMRLASVVGSISGPTTFEGSGLPLGQRSSVCCWAKAGTVRNRTRTAGRMGRIVEQISERNKRLFDIAPILTNPHISNNRD